MKRFCKSVAILLVLASCRKDDDMPFRRLTERRIAVPRPTVGGILDAVEGSLRPHEIDGDIIPIEEGEEYEGPQSGPRVNPLDELHPLPHPSVNLSRLQPIGFNVQIDPGKTVEIFRAGSDDETARPVSLILGQNPAADPTGQGANTFGGMFPNGVGGIGTVPAYLIDWGIGGTSYQVEVDASPGSQFTLIASFVRIRGVNIAGNTSPVNLKGVVAPGPISGRFKPHRSFGINADLPAAARLTQGVLPFAAYVMAYRAPTTGSFRLEFSPGPGVPQIRQVEVDFAAGVSMTDPMPIPGWCQNVALFNTSAGVLTGAALVFLLDL